MGEVCWKKYKDKVVLYEDYRNCSQEEIVALFDKANELTFEAEADRDVLVFANFHGTNFNTDIMRTLKSNDAKKAAKIIKKSAVIGIIGIRQKIMNFYSAFTQGNVKAFDKAEDALNWLVSEEE